MSIRTKEVATTPTLPPPPMAKGHPIWGKMPDFQRDMLGTYMHLALTCGNLSRFRIGPWVSYLVVDPDGVRHVLQENHRGYDKQVFTTLWLKPVVGNGLLTSDGSFWLRQRRLIQPAFHRQRIAALTGTMTECVADCLDRWEALTRQADERGARDSTASKSALSSAGCEVDVAAEMMHLTLEIANRTLFSHSIGADAEVAERTINVFLEQFGYRMRTFFVAPDAFPTPRNRRYKAAIRELDAVIYRIIATRRERATDDDDLLSLLLGVRDEETGEGMDDRQLRDEVMTLFIGGHETTAVVLTWLWVLLAANPAAYERLLAEVDGVLGGRVPTVEDLAQLPYARMCIDETLRLYPPAWGMARRALADDVIHGCRIPKGAVVTLVPYATHRHPDWWEDPEAFDPERFTPERVAARPRFAYFPFGGGPRQCIGNIFALTEAHLAVVMFAQRFRLSLVPGQSVDALPLLTLRPRYAIRMRVERRGG